MKVVTILLMAALSTLAAESIKIDPAKALKIANLEAKRNAIAADFHAARAAASQLNDLQKAVQDADAAYRSAIEAERAAAKLDPSCKLVENITWECPAKPASAPKPSTPEKPEKLEKEKP